MTEIIQIPRVYFWPSGSSNGRLAHCTLDAVIQMAHSWCVCITSWTAAWNVAAGPGNNFACHFDSRETRQNSGYLIVMQILLIVAENIEKHIHNII